METPPYERISAAVVPVETAAPSNGPALSLPTPPETPHHISATVVLVLQSQINNSTSFARSTVPWNIRSTTGSSGPVHLGKKLTNAFRQVMGAD